MVMVPMSVVMQGAAAAPAMPGAVGVGMGMGAPMMGAMAPRGVPVMGAMAPRPGGMMMNGGAVPVGVATAAAPAPAAPDRFDFASNAFKTM